MRTVQLFPMDLQRRTAISVYRSDVRPHTCKRSHNALHRPLLNGFVSGDNGIKILSGKDAGEKADCRPAVARIENLRRGFQAVQSFSVNQYMRILLFNLYSHLPEAGDGRETVCSCQEISNLGCPIRNRTEHNAPVRDGFVPRYRKLAAKRGCVFDYHDRFFPFL